MPLFTLRLSHRLLRNHILILILIFPLLLPFTAFSQRARDLGIPFKGVPGEYNAITDVPGIEVGHSTIIRGEGDLVIGEGPVRTGVTAIFPRGKKFSPVYANWYSLNGNGEMTGTTWITESGFLETPIMITNTNSVGVVRDAVLKWYMDTGWYGDDVLWYTYPVVAETYDGILNDIYGFHVKEENVREAIDNAKGGPVMEGNVGGGTGMMTLGFKGGIGTSSRKVAIGNTIYTLGVLVQSNFGGFGKLVIAGVPVGQELVNTWGMKLERLPLDRKEGDGSIIVVVATDAPLLPHQLKRIAQRVPLGIGNVGGYGENGSGDIFIAFSTANEGAFDRENEVQVTSLPNDMISPLFLATAHATEEAIINAMIAAETMEGAWGNTSYELPEEKVQEVLRKNNRLVEPEWVTPEVLARYTGKYEIENMGSIEIIHADHGLILTGSAVENTIHYLSPAGDHLFRSEPNFMMIRFEEKDGKVTGLTSLKTGTKAEKVE